VRSCDLPNNANGHDIQICLGDERSNTGPINHACLPLQHHVSFLDMNYDEREGVDSSQHKHRPTRPTVEHHKFFMRNSSQIRDVIEF
jgi:hypothetical protein